MRRHRDISPDDPVDDCPRPGLDLGREQLPVPLVGEHRIKIRPLGQGVFDVLVRYGFMEDPDIPATLALEWLHEPNPHGEPNSTVLVPWVNGKDITGPARGRCNRDSYP